MFNNGSFPSATPTPTPAPAQSGANASIAAGIIANMRSGAGMDFPVIGSFSQGTDVTVIRLDGTWYYCQVNGQYRLYLFRLHSNEVKKKGNMWSIGVKA